MSSEYIKLFSYCPSNTFVFSEAVSALNFEREYHIMLQRQGGHFFSCDP